MMKTSKTVNLTSNSLAGATSTSSALTFSIKRSDSYEHILYYDSEDYAPINYRNQTYMESFLDFLTNSRYNLLNPQYIPPLPFISNTYIVITPVSPSAILLGKPYTLTQESHQKELNDQLQRAFGSIIWFTYRRNFPILKPQNTTKNYISDTGWGCMIRAGQMMWAEVLKRLLNVKLHKELMDIITLFLDSEVKLEKAPYSIQQISQITAKNFNVLPGEWYKATTIIMSLEECYENYIKTTVNKDENLIGFSVFPDGCIFIDRILDKVTNVSKCEICSNKQKNKQKCKNNSNNGIMEDEIDNNSTKFKSKLCMKCRNWQKSLFLLVCLRLGSMKPNPEYFPMMKYLLRSPYSVGILGGRPRRALYFVGYQDQNLIIQDPHYVQDSIPSLDTILKPNHINTYFNEEMRGFPMDSIDSSVAFGFYIRNEREFEEFYEYLRVGEQKEENWCLGLQMEFACEDFEEFLYQEENKDEEYEVLGYKD